MRHRTTTSIDVDGIEVELDHNPEFFEPITIQPTPDTLVVGYLLYDQDCENPLTSYDGEGRLYTKPPYYANESVITDDSSAASKLGLNEFGSSRYDPEYDLELDGIEERVAEKLKALIKDDPKLTAWLVSKVMELGENADDVLFDLVQYLAHGTDYARRDWTEDEDQEQIDKLPEHETLAKQAWEELYAEGKIGEYLAVPVDYCHSVHGPGTTEIYTTSLDNCNAVWVPGKCELDNIRTSALPAGAEIKWEGSIGVDSNTLHAVAKINGEVVADCKTWGEALSAVTKILGEPTHADLMAAARKYAESCLKTYESWCNGDCYGIVVETFVKEGDEYERIEEDSYWGFIGQESTEEELKEWMEYYVNKLKEAA